MSEILAAAAIGAGGFIGTVFAIQQVSALIRERRATATTVSKTELERAEREQERPVLTGPPADHPYTTSATTDFARANDD